MNKFLMIGLLTIAIAVSVMTIFTGCKSFKPIYEPIDEPCKIFYDVMIYTDANSKASEAVMGQWSLECRDALKKRLESEKRKQ